MMKTRHVLVFALLLVFASIALGTQQEGGSAETYPWGEGQQGQQVENPYVFREQHFTTGIQTQHGRFRVLPRFSDVSKLLKGIQNFRLAILEADPQTFIIPNHWDADAVVFFAQGEGTVKLLHPERRESFNIRQGDVLRIPSGTTVYLINRHNSQRLIAAKLLIPVSNPGRFEAFFGAGGQEPESFYRVFSIQILEAALNARRDRVQTVFGQQRQGVIIKASQEQIQELSKGEGGIWPFGGERKGKVNIFQQPTSQANQYGQLHEVNANEYGELRDLDVAVSYANITRGGMAGPWHNSRATKISVVVSGEGYLEMACPHLSSQQQGGQESQQGQGQWGGYERLSARLEPGVAFIVPTGHPVVLLASNNQNLEVVCFEVNAFGNERVPLAGRRNVIRQFERVAKQLAFGVPARVVDEVFGSQEEEFFFRGPNFQQPYEGRAYA